MLGNLLIREIEESQNPLYNLKAENGIVELIPENAYKAMAMISYDSSYNNTLNKAHSCEWKKNKEKHFNIQNVFDNDDYKVIGSSAFWFGKLNDKLTESEYSYYIYKVICAVDNENSTHLNGDGVGRKEIWERLTSIPYKEMKSFLENKDDKLIQIISEATTKNRRNISFASKFCHYACRNLLSEEHWDNYPIIDGILKEAIPYYAELYQISYDESLYNSDDIMKSYKEFVTVIDELSKKTSISKTGIDQLLWYYYKGHTIPKKNKG